MKKNILMIMYAKTVGGAELQFLELANYLAKKNRVRLLCLGGSGAIQGEKMCDGLDVKVYTYDSSLSAIVGLLKAFWSNVFYSTETIVTTSFIGNVLGYTLSLFKKVRCISLQTVSVCMRHPIVDEFILKKFEVLVAGANDIKEYLIEHGQNLDKIQVIHNWVDFSKRKATKSALEVKEILGIEGKTAIGCIGRLHPQKGQIYLIRAFSRIVDTSPNTALVLVGDGETRALLEEEVEKLNIAEHVVFTGSVSGDEYNNILSMFDIYVQPSVFEGLPRTLLDAMYLEKPIVATSINGNKEAIRHEVNGLLIPSENDELIFEAVSKLMSDEDWAKTLAKQANKDAKSHFSMLDQLVKIEALI